LRLIDLPYYPQTQPYHCGPACAQMILSASGKYFSQDDLWSSIKAETTGARPAAAPETAGQFASQQCDLCGGVWHCWDTNPPSLSKALNANGPWTMSYMTKYPQTLDEAILALIDSIDTVPATPACASFYAINHWVVVTGYHLEDPSLPGIPGFPIGSLKLLGMFFHNPQSPEPNGTVNWLATADFRQVLGPIICGANQDTYPIVVASWFGTLRILTSAVVKHAARWWLAIVR